MARIADPERLAALRSAGLLDTWPEPALDRLTALASRLLAAPVALIGVIEEDRQLIKSLVGPLEPWPSGGEVPLSHSLCRHVVETERPVVIADALHDARGRDNPGVHASGIVAYLGVPLVTRAGHVLGALCVVDHQARDWSETEVATLGDLASLVMTEVELRRALAETRAHADELARGTALIESVFAAMVDAVVVTDANGHLVRANDAARRLLGERLGGAWTPDVPRALFLSRPDGEGGPAPGDDPFTRAARGEAGGDVDVRLHDRMGGEIWLNVSAQPVRDARGGVVATVAILRDTTARRAAEASLRASEERYRLLADHASDLIRVYAPDGRALYVSPSAERLLGYTPDELLALPPPQPWPDEEGERVSGILASVVATGEGVAPFVHRVRTKAGQERWFETSLEPVRDAGGQVSLVHGISRDVTERVRAERALIDRKERLRRLSDSAFEGIVVSYQGKLLDRNEAAARLFGYSPDEFVDLNVSAFIHPSEREHVARRQQSGFEGVYETIGQRKDGSTFPVEVRGRLAPWGDRMVRITALRDLTERAQAARELERQQGFLRLLEAAAVAANEARTADEAMRTSLALLASHTRWPVGHAYVSDEARPGTLVPTALWHDGRNDPDRLAPFRAATDQTTIASGAGLVGRVLVSGKAAWMADLLADPSCPRADAARRSGLRSGFAFPVLVGRDVAAVLEFYSDQADPLDPALLDVLMQVGTQLGRVVERDRARVALERHAAEIQALSLRDELTELHNRRGFLALAAQQLKHLDRAGGSALLFFADLNGMKQINDTLGHDAGDEAIRSLARVLRATFRDADVLARLGGDEFVVLAHSAGSDTIEALTARLQAGVARHNAATGERPFRLSVSCGAAVYDGRHPRSLEALLAEADARMYEQKKIRQGARVSGPVPVVPAEEPAPARAPAEHDPPA